MFAVGEITRKAERLIEVTYESLEAGIAAAKPGNTTGDIGAAIQAHAEAERTSVVRDFVGHGVGKLFHDEPNIMHFGVPGTGVELKPGMIFTIEPMINLGRPHVKVLADGWTAVTRDRTLSAQCEHSIGITETGLRDLHRQPARHLQPARPAGTEAVAGRKTADRRDDGPRRGASPTISPVTASARASASSRSASRRSQDYELLELVLQLIIPRRDTKELAKDLLARFGTFSGVLRRDAREVRRGRRGWARSPPPTSRSSRRRRSASPATASTATSRSSAHGPR